MAKDFANRNKPTRARTRAGGSRRPSKARKSKHKGFHGPSFSGGILLGAAIVVTAAYAPELLEEASGGTIVGSSDNAKPTVEFRFDKILRNQEVQTDPRRYVADPHAPGEEGEVEYLIQAASFQNREDADTLRAQLLLSGLPATTNPVRVGDKPWFRVTVGPFPNSTESGRALTKLRELNLDAFLMKRQVRQPG